MFMWLMLLLALVPFVIIHCMPGKKSFAAISLLALCLLVFLLLDIKNADGPGAFLGITFAYMIIFGTVAGLLSKAATLFMAYRGTSSKKRFLVSVLGLALIPCFVYVPQLYNDWDRRAPSDSCKYDMITFSINGQLFRVPGLNILTANKGSGQSVGSDMSDFFAFYGNKDYRKFCDAFDNGSKPANVNAISINFDNLARATLTNQNFVSLCEQAQWPDAICKYIAPPYKVRDGYPSKIAVYNKNNFSAEYLGGGWDAARVKEKMATADKPSDIEGFRFDGRYYYSLSNIDDVELALKCFKSSSGLYCNSEEQYVGDVFMHWAGIIDEDMPITSALAVRKTARGLLQILDSSRKD